MDKAIFWKREGASGNKHLWGRTVDKDAQMITKHQKKPTNKLTSIKRSLRGRSCPIEEINIDKPPSEQR